MILWKKKEEPLCEGEREFFCTHGFEREEEGSKEFGLDRVFV